MGTPWPKGQITQSVGLSCRTLGGRVAPWMACQGVLLYFLSELHKAVSRIFRKCFLHSGAFLIHKPFSEEWLLCWEGIWGQRGKCLCLWEEATGNGPGMVLPALQHPAGKAAAEDSLSPSRLVVGRGRERDCKLLSDSLKGTEKQVIKASFPFR